MPPSATSNLNDCSDSSDAHHWVLQELFDVLVGFVRAVSPRVPRTALLVQHIGVPERMEKNNSILSRLAVPQVFAKEGFREDLRLTYTSAELTRASSLSLLPLLRAQQGQPHMGGCLPHGAVPSRAHEASGASPLCAKEMIC